MLQACRSFRAHLDVLSSLLLDELQSEIESRLSGPCHGCAFYHQSKDVRAGAPGSP